MDSSSKQLLDPCRISAATSMQPDLSATDVKRVPGSRHDLQWLTGLTRWSDRRAKGRSQMPLNFTSPPSYYAGKLPWLIRRSVWFQTKSSRDISGRPTGPCRRKTIQPLKAVLSNKTNLRRLVHWLYETLHSEPLCILITQCFLSNVLGNLYSILSRLS